MPKNESCKGCLIAAVGLALLSGCFGGASAQRQARAQKRTFVPLAAAVNPVAPSPGFAPVKIRAFRALPPFDARTFIVRRAGGEFAADYYNGWLAAPHELIRAQVARYLEEAGLFAAVYDSSSGTIAPLGLEGVVSELYLDASGDAPAAVVTLRLLVLDERTSAFTVLATCERSVRAAFDPADPTAASQAFGRALTQALEALAAALARAPLPRP
jgi:ABC-type uncharacterized transport system auxiliary subunit